ncbi:single-stranded DNA binding [Tyrophagus putrescentiae]|nr:single-stranded DNA binding [Tyrophagus putrescentiae]
MGVTGLWNLIEDSGTKVNIETLRGKVLAIDLSIWINQSIKGFRDKNGKAVENAHILGLYHRICKLLFYNIRPIFVFDGECPTLKSRTLAKRHEKTRKALAKSKNMSLNVLEKYVNSQLGNDDNSSALLAAAKSKLRLSGQNLLSELFLPPRSDNRQVDIYQEFVELNKQISNRIDDSDSEEGESNADDTTKNNADNQAEVDVSYHVPSNQHIRDIDINSEHFKNLPATTRYEILLEIRESYKGRKNPFPENLPSDSDVFSQYQMSKLLKKRNLQEEIDKLINELNGINNEANIELFGKSSSIDFGLLSTKYKEVVGGRLASDEHSRFLLFKTSQSQICEPPNEKESKHESSSEVTTQSEKQNLELSSQNFAYSLPNSLVDSGVQNLSDYNRIEHLSQASTSTNTTVQFQPKQLVVTLNLRLLEAKALSKWNPLEDSQSSDFSPVKDESNAFLESLDLPYDTSYNLLINMEKDYQKDDESNILPEATPSDSITTSIEIAHDSLKDNEHQTEPVIPLSTNSQTEMNPIPEEKEEEEAVQQTVDDVALLDSKMENVADKPAVDSVNASPAALAPVQSEQSQIAKEPPIISVEELLQQAQESNKISRQAASVTKQMVDDCQELMRLFGVPWVVAPSEAEAQCAALEQLGLAEGVITDDSDVFLFGGSRVLRHFFTDSKMITQYLVEDLQKFFGLDRSKLICLGMLCGTDYTLGIDGIGPVTGLEVLSEFPGDELQPLQKYAEWYREKLYSPDVSGKPENPVRAKLLKFSLPQTFPSRVIFDAYYSANVDSSKEAFSWASPQLSELRRFAKSKFGWSEPKSDAILLPVLKNLNEKKTQTRIDFFFSSFSKNSAVTEKLNIKKSKRFKAAIQNIQQQKTEVIANNEPKRGKKRQLKKNRTTASTSKANTLVLSEESSSSDDSN